MNIFTINMLWFEDEKAWFDEIKEELSEKVSELGFILDINYQKKNARNNYENELDSFDVIISDLALDNPLEGVAIINAVRASNNLTPIVLYSASGLSALEKILKENLLQGVFILNRKDPEFSSKVIQHINGSIHKLIDVRIMQGLILSAVAELDSKHYEVIEKHIKNNADKEVEIIEDLKTTIVGKLNSFSQQNSQKISDSEPLEFFNLIKSTKYFPTMQRKDYVKDKVISDHNTRKKISGIQEVINRRNDLAHSKIISSSSSSVVFDSETENYNFNNKEAIELRKKIIKYFQGLDEYLREE